MSYTSIPIWKEAPFIRLIVPLMAGILIEWHCPLPVAVYKLIMLICFTCIILFSFLKTFTRFKKYWIGGIPINILLICLGGIITCNKDLRNSLNCITGIEQTCNTFVVTLIEPLSEKSNSFKANAAASEAIYNDTARIVEGNIVLYFQKDSALHKLAYNSRLVLFKSLQPIKNSGNPGAFDYQRYCIFQQLYYQVYLKPGDYILLPGISDKSFNQLLFKIRKEIVTILQTYIKGEKEAGLAEALLIGYKDDLDKNLVQSYSNTGVVHIIAISGLHLALIYWLLNLLLKPLKTKGRMRWIKAILIIAGLWLFSMLSGGSASVCRSALMFTLIVMGENIDRKTNIYNSLAASAFLLLCYNPYWLWDAGFQLSYIAVLSIIVFMKPVYNWFYIKNKLLDQVWKMAAISIAAQMLTTPVSIYHFQQFPNYFLITNLVAVPLSSLVVLAELALCVLSFSTLLATPAGNITSWLITIMNGFIDYINKMPFTTTSSISLSSGQLLLIYLFIFSAGIWLFQKNKTALIIALAFIVCFVIIKSYYNIKASYQEKLIVFNVPHRQAIDLIKGHHCIFIGDSMISNNIVLQNFILRPSRNKYRIREIKKLQPSPGSTTAFGIGNKHVVVIDGSIDALIYPATYNVDILILSGNANVTIGGLQKIIECKQIIFDSSNSYGKIQKWKAECKNANIAYHAVAESGAFILNLN